jgi:hypothetical protein
VLHCLGSRYVPQGKYPVPLRGFSREARRLPRRRRIAPWQLSAKNVTSTQQNSCDQNEEGPGLVQTEEAAAACPPYMCRRRAANEFACHKLAPPDRSSTLPGPWEQAPRCSNRTIGNSFEMLLETLERIHFLKTFTKINITSIAGKALLLDEFISHAVIHLVRSSRSPQKHNSSGSVQSKTQLLIQTCKAGKSSCF